MKNKYTACYCKWCRNTIPAVSFRVSSLRFLHGIVFATQTLWIHVFVQYVLSGSDWGRHSKSCSKTPLGNMAVSTAWQISRGPATSSTTGVWDVLCHILSTAEEVMIECDIHHTRAIKTNSAANLSRKPGLDLCCDLQQHLPGVPRTCSFYIIKDSVAVAKTSDDW